MVRHQPSGLYYLAKVAETNSKGVSVEYPGWEGEAELLRWNTDRVVSRVGACLGLGLAGLRLGFALQTGEKER